MSTDFCDVALDLDLVFLEPLSIPDPFLPLDPSPSQVSSPTRVPLSTPDPIYPPWIPSPSRTPSTHLGPPLPTLDPLSLSRTSSPPRTPLPTSDLLSVSDPSLHLGPLSAPDPLHPSWTPFPSLTPSTHLGPALRPRSTLPTSDLLSTSDLVSTPESSPRVLSVPKPLHPSRAPSPSHTPLPSTSSHLHPGDPSGRRPGLRSGPLRQSDAPPDPEGTWRGRPLENRSTKGNNPVDSKGFSFLYLQWKSLNLKHVDFCHHSPRGHTSSPTEMIKVTRKPRD